MSPRRYKPIEKCRPEIQDYIEELGVGTDDDDVDKRDTTSTDRYEQDLRWFDSWLDAEDIDSAYDVSPADANRIGRSLIDEFNGTTPRYRWDRIYSFYEYLNAMELVERNPLSKWDARKTEKWGMTKTTEQSKQISGDERYSVSQEEVRLMEEHAGRNRERDQLVIRLMYHSGMRRNEASEVTLDMVDRNKREITLPARVTKNDKERVVCWGSSLDGLMNTWLDRGLRDEYLGGNSHDYLLVGERGAQLSGSAINDIIVNAADRAGINRKMYADSNSADGKPNRWKISSHSVRKGTGSYLINELGLDLYAVSKYLGHADLSITERIYVEYDPRTGADAVQGHLP
jgi:integrase/recombinase XerD